MSSIHWIVYIFIASFSFCIYFNSIFCGFVWDDRAAILSNRDLINVNKSYETMFDFLRHDFWGQNITYSDSHKSYRPVTTLTYIIDNYMYGGLNPVGFHLSNVFIFTLSSLAMLYFASLWLKPEGAFVASVLFVCHPVHVEAVAGLVGRADCLCGLFYLLSLVLYSHSQNHTQHFQCDPLVPVNTNDKKSIRINYGLNRYNKRLSLYSCLFSLQSVYFLLSFLMALFASFAKEIGVTVFGVIIVLEFIFFFKEIVADLLLPLSQSSTSNCYSGNDISTSLVWREIFKLFLRTSIFSHNKHKNQQNNHQSHGKNNIINMHNNSHTSNSSVNTNRSTPSSTDTAAAAAAEINNSSSRSWVSMYILPSVTRIFICVLMIGLLSVLRIYINGAHTLYNWTVLENHVTLLPAWKTRALTYAQTHFWYMFKLIYPRHLSFDYGFACMPTIENIYDVRNIFPLTAYSVLIGVIVYALYIFWSPSLLLGVSLIVLPLLPASNLLFPVGTLLAERLLFVPSTGICLVLGRLLTYELVPYWQWMAGVCYQSYLLSVMIVKWLAVRLRHKQPQPPSLVHSDNINKTSAGNKFHKQSEPIHIQFNNNNNNNSHQTSDNDSHNQNIIPNTKELQIISEKYAGVALLCLWLLPVTLLCTARVMTRNKQWKNEKVLFRSALHICPLSVKTLSNHGLTSMSDDIDNNSKTRLHIEESVLSGSIASALYSNHTAAFINTALAYQDILSNNNNNQHTNTDSDPQNNKQNLHTTKLMIRSLYILQQAMYVSNFTSAKAYGYSGNALYNYVTNYLIADDTSHSLHKTLQHYVESNANINISYTFKNDLLNNKHVSELLQQEVHRVSAMLKEIAANQIETAVYLGLESPSLLHILGSIYLDIGNADAAVYYLQTALRLSPSATSSTHTSSTNNTKHHIPHKSMALSVKSEDVKLANTYNQLGNAFIKTGQTRKAVEAYVTGLRYDPSLIPLYVNLGSLYSNVNQPENARVWLLKALRFELIQSYSSSSSSSSSNTDVSTAYIPTLSTLDTEIDNWISESKVKWHTLYTVSPALLNNLGLAELALNKSLHASYYFHWALIVLDQQGLRDSYIGHTVLDNLKKINN